MIRLSILICSMPRRYEFLSALLSSINAQPKALLQQTEILINCDSGHKSIGAKRNELLSWAKGEYVVFVDDDDEISEDYLEQIFIGIGKGVDCIGISMMYSPSAGEKKPVDCSIENTIWGESHGAYLRTIQHVCPIKRELATLVKYPDTSFGEDKDYAEAIKPYLHTEYRTGIIYTYKFRIIKTV